MAKGYAKGLMSASALLMLLMAPNALHAEIVKGKITDMQSGEEIIGASVVIKEYGNKGTSTGLDGCFRIPLQKFPCTLVCQYLGYKTTEVTVETPDDIINIGMETNAVALGDAVEPRDGQDAAGIRRKRP